MPNQLVLIGGGHSHVEVLRQFALKPVPNTDLTLICENAHTPYSGMLPGYVAGHYRYEQVHINLRPLAEAVGAKFYETAAIGINRDNQTVHIEQHPPLPYDQLSINIGSTPNLADAHGAREHAIAVKPIRDFNQRWLALLERVKTASGPLHIAVVGGGAGGVELLLAMQHRLAAYQPRFSLWTRGAQILPTHNTAVQKKLMHVLEARGVEVHCQAAVNAVTARGLVSADGQHHAADEVIWVTRASGAEWLKQTGLALDQNGFIKVTDTLQTNTDPQIFAAGDVASMINHPLEKAGVVAVRQAPILTHNLRNTVTGGSLKPYQPQRHWLALISTGDQYAIASRGKIIASGRWVWRCKDWIDRRFMRRYN